MPEGRKKKKEKEVKLVRFLCWVFSVKPKNIEG
jgi:hypothetical protein